MPRDANIPLFLWIATAAMVHLVWGGAATTLSRALQDMRTVAMFAQTVQEHMGGGTGPIEVALLEDMPDDKSPKTVPPKADPEELDESKPEPTEAKKEKPKPAPQSKPEEKPKPKVAVKVEKKEEDKKPPEKIELDKKKRIAVVQHVDDPSQKDNPDAEFIGDKANRVKEQTQARITSTNQNDKKPNPGGNHSAPTEAPGNSEETRVAQDKDSPGDPDRAPDPAPPPAAKPSKTQPPEPASEPPAGAPKRIAKNTAVPRRGAAAQRAVEASPEMVTAENGADSVAKQREAVKGQKHKKRKKLPPARSGSLLGLGATGTTKSGVNLNLSPQTAYAAIGRDRLAMERKMDAQRRRSLHRGSWKSLGIERWRAAIENYVPSVKPGNQTALNTARVPFASYLNAIHNRLHPIFADSFLASLGNLPGTHPMNRPDIKTHLEIVLSEQDGRVVRMGVTRTSGVTAFDIAALESVQRGSPYGAPPREIVSPDGNVYFHWEFHRNPYYACSTYFARPYLLKVKPKTAPPKVAPPEQEPYDPKDGPPPGDRHGSASPKASPRARLAAK